MENNNNLKKCINTSQENINENIGDYTQVDG